MSSAFRARLGLVVFLALAVSRLAAAPGQATSTGPFVVLGDDAYIARIEQLVFPGSDPRRMLARTLQDVYATRDGGVTWRSLLPHGSPLQPRSLSLDAANPDHFFVFGANPDGRAVLETRDAGLGWTFVPMPDSDPPSSLVDFFADAHDSQTLVITRSNFFSSYLHYLSRDGGQSWSPLVSPAFASQLIGVDRGVVYFEKQKVALASGAWTSLPDPAIQSVSWLGFDRVRPNTLFVTTNGASPRLAKSEDGGLTFETSLFLSPSSPQFDFSQSALDPSHLAGHIFGSLAISLDRGATWTADLSLNPVEQTAFDPATGEIVMTNSTFDYGRRFTRRALDGALSAMPSNGLPEAYVRMVWARGEKTFALTDRFQVRDAEGMWQRRGRIGEGIGRCYNGAALVISPADPQNMVVACGGNGIFFTRDGGFTWHRAAAWPNGNQDFYPPDLGLASEAGGPVLYAHLRGDLEDGTGLYRSLDFGSTWQLIGEHLLEVAIHPDAARGVVAIHEDGSLVRYLPASGWQTIPTTRSFGRVLDQIWDSALGHDPAHPELIYAVAGGAFLRSQDFGATWQIRSLYPDAFAELFGPHPFFNPVGRVAHIVIDPFDADHWLLPAQGYETRDGGLTFGRSTRGSNFAADFDPLTPGRFLAGTDERGVLEITSSLPPCPNTDKTWCAKGGRFQLTVDWKDPQGNKGRAVEVATGSEESGLFYFFDPNNWELLVKVLDGCGLNQRFWLLAAGTTDVAYVLQVEDRWTGQIRHYANAAGQAAPAIVDTDAFSGCGATPPPGAPPGEPRSASVAAGSGGETRLDLLGGRFEVETTWTDFGGATGPGRTAPLRSDNSGLFYFFSPDNWEMLVKVLDGCAINNHYWVLAAATTDVGYRLEVRDSSVPGRQKTYTNPVGRAAPALLDLQAFSCQLSP